MNFVMNISGVFSIKMRFITFENFEVDLKKMNFAPNLNLALTILLMHPVNIVFPNTK